MNIKVDFDNIVVKEDKNDFNVKVLMLKGEKGDKGDGEANVIEKVQVNGTNLPVTNKTVNVPVPIVDSTLSSSSTNPVQNNTIYNALSNKADTSALDNYYEISEVDALLNQKANINDIEDDLLKISKKAYYFNNVAEMKSYNLQEGDFVLTKGYYSANDGGHGEYIIKSTSTEYYELLENGLVAELISDKSNIYCYGITVDDNNNDNASIINNVISNQSKIYANLDFEINDSIIIDQPNKEFNFVNIKYNGNDTAIILNSNGVVINGLTITSSHDGFKLGNDNLTYNNKININEITAENNSIVIGGSVGIWSDIFDVNKVNYKNHGIYFDLTESYCGQIGFYNTAFNDLSSGNDDNYAIYMDCSLNDMTGLDMYNITFEGTKGGLYVTSSTYHYLEHLHIYGVRLGELSVTKRKKAIKLISSNLGCKINGNIDFDEVISDAFDLSEYHSYSQNSLVFNGSIRRLGSTDLLATKSVASYGGIILTEYSRQVTPTHADNQVLTYVYDRINVANGTGTHVKINVMPNNNELFASPFRVYIAGDSITKLNLVRGSNNGQIYQETCGQGDVFEIIPGARHYEYMFDILVNHYKHSDNSVSVFRISL